MRRSDQQCVLQAQVGDHAAYGELVARHQSRVRGWLRHLCGDHAEADDLAQEAFVRAWTRLGSLKDAKRFSSWLMKIAYNEFLQSRRSSDRRNRIMERYALERKALESAATEEAPAHDLELRQALSLLSEKERAAVVLNYAYGYSHGEVSELTGIPLGTVKSLIHRGGLKVRERFDARD
ncbi:MAG: RNA polymerase sigma factor [Gammaproteobacteria bacterium]|nr:RNA polymerase sigma factor [Gammaproteobacteria bacterium]MCY4341272.1 RNA polymerase sigma factor [Gammaproteobacteria bacterium]